MMIQLHAYMTSIYGDFFFADALEPFVIKSHPEIISASSMLWTVGF